jgi:flagellar biosynthesis protein FliR
MPVEVSMATADALRFLLVLTRVSSVFVFAGLPGLRNTPPAARIVTSICITLALFPLWPSLPDASPTIGTFIAWIAGEAALGLTAGLAVSFLLESMVMSAQIFGLQAGYGYATTIDPNSEADSGTLQVIAHLVAQLFFFAFGLHRQMLLFFAGSLSRCPFGSFTLRGETAEIVIGWGTAMLESAVRLAMPVVVLLLLSDLTLACLGRINQQLQLLTLTFPVKMLACLAILCMLAPSLPRLYESLAIRLFGTLPRILGN